MSRRSKWGFEPAQAILSFAVGVALLLAVVRRLDAQQQNNTWQSLICFMDGGVGYVYGEYKDSDGKIHVVDGIYWAELSDWEIMEAGNHNAGAFGAAGQHGHLVWWYSSNEHEWGVASDDGVDEGAHEDWDFHVEHSRMMTRGLFNASGFLDQ